jgi:hypothetical protein
MQHRLQEKAANAPSASAHHRAVILVISKLF